MKDPQLYIPEFAKAWCGPHKSLAELEKVLTESGVIVSRNKMSLSDEISAVIAKYGRPNMMPHYRYIIQRADSPESKWFIYIVNSLDGTILGKGTTKISIELRVFVSLGKDGSLSKREITIMS